MLPQITELEFNTQEVTEDLPKQGKSFLFDFEKGDFVLRDGKLVEVYGKEALKIFVKKTLRTQRYRFEIYKDVDYGINTADLIGTSYPKDFVHSEMRREIITALTAHPFIDNILNFEFEKVGSSLKVKFVVATAYDSFEQEVDMIV